MVDVLGEPATLHLSRTAHREDLPTCHEPTASPSFPATASAPKSCLKGLRVLDAAARAFDLTFEFEHFDHSSADYYVQHGKMLPDNWFDELRGFDAIYFGAVGWPDVVPDHVSLWGVCCSFVAPSTST